jgi:hypothetical protein
MTPKEKAQDLVNQFRMVLMNEDTECGNEILCTSIAYENALITVNEILNTLNETECYSNNANYWLDVRCELNTMIIGENE